MFRILTILLFAGTLFFLTESCREDEFTSSSSDKLGYSDDTITFDTIFTTIGSVTHAFKIYNSNNKFIRISSAYLKGGENSKFRLNINGVPGREFENIEIPPDDSIFVFVEVTLDLVNDNNPVLVEDAVVFSYNGNSEEVILEAIGQDVHLYNGVIIKSETWINDKPYLILNSMAVDSGEVLTIEKGVKVYLHNSSSLIVWGNLHINGTYEEPVVFNGDRFDRGYDRSAGGWETIFIHPRSRGNVINYAVIKNSVRGIQVGQPEDNIRMPSLTLNNVCISNSSFSCIFAFAAEIEANNCIFADAQYYGLAFLMGGKYNINHCTVSMVGSFRVAAGLFEEYRRDAGGACIALSNRYFPYYTFDKNYIFYEKTLYNDLSEANFTNSIFYGNHKLELILDNHKNADFNYLFDHCLLKQTADSVDTTDAVHFRNIILNKYPRFNNDSIINKEYNFSLDTLSPAKDAGIMEIINKYPVLKYDYEGKLRTADGKPDLGAFEREE
jgi:hypothetical protein